MSAVTPLHPRLCPSLLPAAGVSSRLPESGSPPSSPAPRRHGARRSMAKHRRPRPCKHRVMELGAMGGDLGFAAVWRSGRGIFQSTLCKGLAERVKLLLQGQLSFGGLKQ